MQSDAKIILLSWSPLQSILTLLAGILLVNAVIIFFMLEQPVLGVDFKPKDGRVYMTSRSTEGWGMADALEVIELSSAGSSLKLEVSDLMEEPDLFTLYEQYNQFLTRQSQLSGILKRPMVVVNQGSDSQLELKSSKAQLRDLPALFWMQLLVASVSLLAGFSVWLFRRNERSAIHYGWMGFFLALTIWPAAIYSSRELALEGGVIRILSALNHVGTFFTMAAVLSLIWYYHKPLWRLPFDRWVYGVISLHWISDIAQWYPNQDVGLRLPALLALTLCFVLLAVHWRRSKSEIVYRQSIKWFLLVIVLGCGAFVAVQMVPPLLGSSPLVSQGLSFVAFLSIYLGLAFGVIHYHLFDLDRWWFEVWGWIALGLILVGIDFFIVSLFSFSHEHSLWLALAVTGWAYFPLRQWVITRLLKKGQEPLEHYLPMIVRSIATARDSNDLVAACQQGLLDIYRPLSFKRVDVPEAEVRIDNYGLALHVPFLQDGQSLIMEYPEQGRRLFQSLDTLTVSALVRLYRQAWDASQLRDQAIKQERERIKQDIHDTLGGRLLSIMRQKTDPKVAVIASMAWRELRDILAAMEGRRESLVIVVDQWRKDVEQMAESSGVSLDWSLSDELRDRQLIMQGKDRMQVGQILREAVSNALRHSNTDFIKLMFSLKGQSLQLHIENNGLKSEVGQWQANRGLHHIRQRAGLLNAAVEWVALGEQSVRFELDVPVGEWR